MTFYNYYIVLNFGFDLVREQSLNIRAGTAHYREENSNSGRIRFYHRGSKTAKSYGVIEIFISKEIQWSYLLQKGIRKILHQFTPCGASKFIIAAHGFVNSTQFGSNPQMIPAKKRKGKPMSMEQATRFFIKITDIAILIAQSIKKEIFDKPENFFAITLWSCYAGKSESKFLKEIPSMAESLLRELLKLRVYSRVRAPIRSLTINAEEPEWRTPPPPQTLPGAVTAPINLREMDTNRFYDRIKFSEILHLEYARTLIADPDDIPEHFLIYARAIMLLFMMNERNQVTCCIPAEGLPFQPDPNSLYDKKLLFFLSFCISIFEVLIHALHFSNINRLTPELRQPWFDRLRETQRIIWYAQREPIERQRIQDVFETAKHFINDLHGSQLITDPASTNAIDRLDAILDDEIRDMRAQVGANRS